MTNRNREKVPVKKRNDAFSKKIRTKIWSEDTCPDNPFIAQNCRIHGYEIEELTTAISFTESIYLNLKGELPSQDEKKLMDAVFVAFSNLGPRHPATRAVMNAAASKTKISHLLPIGLTILSGDHSGTGEVESAVRFIRKNINKPAESIAKLYLEKFNAPDESNENDSNTYTVAPGFGDQYGSIDIIAEKLAQKFLAFNATERALPWGITFSKAINKQGYGWRLTGIAAACFSDLGFSPKACAGLFQIAATPGLLAHGLEMSNQPLTAMPFVDDSDYHYTEKKS